MIYTLLTCVLMVMHLSQGNILGTVNGTGNWTTWIKGDGPIVIISQHDGNDLSSVMDPREPGCWNSTNNTCIWQKNCEITYAPLRQDSTNCGVTGSRDSNTYLIAKHICQHATFTLSDGHTYHPHCILMNVHRNRTDANREAGEACLGDANCLIAYNDFHGFVTSARASAVSNCGFGIGLDIHGQQQNDYVNLGYRISENKLNESNNAINAVSFSSIHSLKTWYNLTSVIRSINSLGDKINSKIVNGWKALPSSQYPYPLVTVGTTYFSGDYSTDKHGSRYGGTFDFVQVEIPKHIRNTTLTRNTFSQHISQAIVEWIQFWHATRYTNCHVTP